MNARRSTAASLALVAILLVTSACSFSMLSWSEGTSVEMRNGVMFVDGVELAHSRWVKLVDELDPAGEIFLHTPTGPLTVTGQDGNSVSLEALVHSEVEGDGEVRLINDRLTVTPSEGRKAVINAIRGSLPSGLAIEASSGTGDVSLTGFDGGRDLRLHGGTGSLGLYECKLGRLDIDSGTAEVNLASVSGTHLELKTGTGDVELKSCSFETSRFESGTGDLLFEGGELASLVADTGTGDITLRGTQVGTLEVDSGTGDVTLAAGAEAAKIDLDLGTGDLLRR